MQQTIHRHDRIQDSNDLVHLCACYMLLLLSWYLMAVWATHTVATSHNHSTAQRTGCIICTHILDIECAHDNPSTLTLVLSKHTQWMIYRHEGTSSNSTIAMNRWLGNFKQLITGCMHRLNQLANRPVSRLRASQPK